MMDRCRFENSLFFPTVDSGEVSSMLGVDMLELLTDL